MPGIPKSTEIMRKLLIVMVCLAAVSEAAAQRMPERRSVRRGNRPYAHERFAEAVGQYERALEAAPECFEARYDLGNALYRAGRYDGAEQAMRAAAADTLRSDDERAEAFFNLGDAQFRQEKYREALESYKQSLRLNPADAEAKYNYAYTKRLLEQQEQQQQERNDGSDSGEQSGDGASQQSGGDPQEGGERPDDGDGQKGAEGPEQEERNDGDGQERPGEEDGPDDGRRDGAQGAARPGISEEEQERMLDAIQAQEDRTQEKLREREGTVVRGHRNW